MKLTSTGTTEGAQFFPSRLRNMMGTELVHIHAVLELVSLCAPFVEYWSVYQTLRGFCGPVLVYSSSTAIPSTVAVLKMIFHYSIDFLRQIYKRYLPHELLANGYFRKGVAQILTNISHCDRSWFSNQSNPLILITHIHMAGRSACRLSLSGNGWRCGVKLGLVRNAHIIKHHFIPCSNQFMRQLHARLLLVLSIMEIECFRLTLLFLYMKHYT